MSSASLISRIVPRTFRRHDAGWIGIDVGQNQIKLAQVNKQGERWSLTYSEILPLPEGEYAQNAVAAITARHLRSSSFIGRNVACAASMSVSELLTMEFPDGSDEELRLMIEQNLEEGNDTADEPRQFAFWRGHFTRHLDSGMTQIHVAAAKKKMVASIAEGLFKSGLYCQVFDVLPFALVRAMSMLPDADESRACGVFDWSGVTPLFMIVKNRQPIFTRQFRNCGVEHIVQLLCTKLGLDRHESEHLLGICHPGTAASDVEHNPIRELVTGIMSEPLKNLAREFEKTLAYVRQQRSEMWPEKLWICGGGASLASVESIITDMTGIDASIWHRPDLTQQDVPVPPARQAMLCTAMALSTLAYNL